MRTSQPTDTEEGKNRRDARKEETREWTKSGRLDSVTEIHSTMILHVQYLFLYDNSNSIHFQKEIQPWQNFKWNWWRCKTILLLTIVLC
jgi:hypothetical protein